MKIEELKNKIENSQNKLSIFLDTNYILSCEGITYNELVELVNTYLDDIQKQELFSNDLYSNSPVSCRVKILNSIGDQSIRLRYIKDKKIMDGISSYEVVNIIKSFPDDFKIQILRDISFLKQYDVNTYNIEDVIKYLSEEKRIELLKEKDFLSSDLGLDNFNLTRIISTFDKVENKTEMLNTYDLESYQKLDILKTFPINEKIQTILKNTYNLEIRELTELTSSLDTESLINFLNSNEEFLKEKNISIEDVTRRLDKQSSIELVSKLDLLNCSQIEKNMVLATLNEEAKKEVSRENLSKEEKDMLEIKKTNLLHKPKDSYNNGLLEVNLDEDVEKFKGLDKYVIINPKHLSKTQLENFCKLCDICPNMQIADDIGISSSTVEEYKKGELWITQVLGKITDEMTDIEKIAIIDNEIGKKISYSPDFDTETFKEGDARSLWKIISTGYGVCNGISQVACYMLGRVGIDAKMVSGEHHSFVKLSNITIPREDGTSITGNTILDPTWD